MRDFERNKYQCYIKNYLITIFDISSQLLLSMFLWTAFLILTKLLPLGLLRIYFLWDYYQLIVKLIAKLLQSAELT